MEQYTKPELTVISLAEEDTLLMDSGASPMPFPSEDGRHFNGDND